MPDEVAEMGENGARNVQTAADKAVSAGTPTGCREGASAGGATGGQRARDGGESGRLPAHWAPPGASRPEPTSGNGRALAGVGGCEEAVGKPMRVSPQARSPGGARCWRRLGTIARRPWLLAPAGKGARWRPWWRRAPTRKAQSSVASSLPRRTARSRRRSLAPAGRRAARSSATRRQRRSVQPQSRPHRS